ncbi:zinc finger C2HC domain-containing protein 1B-like [Pristis pectinata]|uniref:zinc finger C2HC domain-containing protein 1B-like n=1 Tax=Pristis pectinata TaxID=685728 RepID=UPI00223E7D54|nr:zinc finger C2HC domain-containing protein 1B-like [Pristis pectinata]
MAPPVSHWREQHEDFINTVKNARLTADAMKKGLPLPPPPPPTINPAGSPSKGKLTAAAQAVMGIRAESDDPSMGRVSDTRGQPPAP